MARHQSEGAPDVSHECRHHRRGYDAEGAAGARRQRKRQKGVTGALARGGRMLGQIEEYFIEGLVVGDTFVFGGEVVRYESLVEDQVYVSRAR